MEYDFNLIRQPLLEARGLYTSGTEEEQDTVVSKLAVAFDELYPNIFRKQNLIIRYYKTTSGMSAKSFAHKLIQCVLDFGIEKTIKDLYLLFSKKDAEFQVHRRLMGIRINQNYFIDSSLELKIVTDVSSNPIIELSNNQNPETIKNYILFTHFITPVELVLTGNIEIIANTQLDRHMDNDDWEKERFEYIHLLISFITKTSCAYLYDYINLTDNCLFEPDKSVGFRPGKYMPSDERHNVDLDIDKLRRLIDETGKFDQDNRIHLRNILQKYAESLMLRHYTFRAVELRTIAEALFVTNEGSMSLQIRQRGALFLGIL